MTGIIYILCPANVVTGGIELLHQLCYKLTLLGYNAKMYYIDMEKKGVVVPKVYDKYHTLAAESLEDTPDNYFVIPEVYLFLYSEFRYGKRIIWWLSIDNAYGFPNITDEIWKDDRLIHLVQSEYARRYVESHGIGSERILWLSDYINSEFLHLKRVPAEEKQDVILFNPRKGFEKTAELIKNSSGKIMWRALTGFTPKQMRKVLQKSKLYIDFGNHPGKDRIPREAILCDCLLITNKKGAAANDIDVPIDSKYKYDNDMPEKEILADIMMLLENYEEEHDKYESYRRRTEEEFRSFEIDVMKVFEQICGTVWEEASSGELKERMLAALQSGDIHTAYQNLICMLRQYPAENDFELMVIEATIRKELREYNEAEYIAKRALRLKPDNYEVILLLAQIHYGIGEYEELLDSKEECLKAMQLSQGTEDEFAVRELAMNCLKDVLQSMKEHSTEEASR